MYFRTGLILRTGEAFKMDMSARTHALVLCTAYWAIFNDFITTPAHASTYARYPQFFPAEYVVSLAQPPLNHAHIVARRARTIIFGFYESQMDKPWTPFFYFYTNCRLYPGVTTSWKCILSKFIFGSWGGGPATPHEKNSSVNWWGVLLIVWNLMREMYTFFRNRWCCCARRYLNKTNCEYL